MLASKRRLAVCCALGRDQLTRFRSPALVVVQVMVLLTVIFGFAALSIDLGLIYLSTAEMQVAVDAGALSGATSLSAGNATAADEARAYAARHYVDAQAMVTGPGTVVDVVIGNWEGLSRTFNPLTGTESVAPNAVRVMGERNPLDLLFAPVLGVMSTYVTKHAVAARGSGRCAGIWGLDGITGNGNIQTDSYDSRDGAYGGANIRPNGDICSNGDIELNGSAVDIYGDAMWGPAASLLIAGQPKVWGITGPLCCAADAPTVDTTDAMLNNDNLSMALTDKGNDPFGGTQWDYAISGNDHHTITGGTFYFTSALIEGVASVTVTGPTVMYISGPASFGGNGLINATGDPSNLVIYSTGTTMMVDGTAGFYGSVVAPNADILLQGTSEYFGVLLGKTIDIDGTADIHVDEAAVEAIFGVESEAPILVE